MPRRRRSRSSKLSKVATTRKRSKRRRSRSRIPSRYRGETRSPKLKGHSSSYSEIAASDPAIIDKVNTAPCIKEIQESHPRLLAFCVILWNYPDLVQFTEEFDQNTHTPYKLVELAMRANDVPETDFEDVLQNYVPETDLHACKLPHAELPCLKSVLQRLDVKNRLRLETFRAFEYDDSHLRNLKKKHTLAFICSIPIEGENPFIITIYYDKGINEYYILYINPDDSITQPAPYDDFYNFKREVKRLFGRIRDNRGTIFRLQTKDMSLKPSGIERKWLWTPVAYESSKRSKTIKQFLHSGTEDSEG
mgnify:CR=1 FL=1